MTFINNNNIKEIWWQKNITSKLNLFSWSIFIMFHFFVIICFIKFLSCEEEFSAKQPSL